MGGGEAGGQGPVEGHHERRGLLVADGADAGDHRGGAARQEDADQAQSGVGFGLAHVAGGEDDQLRWRLKSFEVVPHERSVGQAERREESVPVAELTVRGDVSERRVVQGGTKALGSGESTRASIKNPEGVHLGAGMGKIRTCGENDVTLAARTTTLLVGDDP